MSVSCAMRQMEERHVATKVELMVWCSKMDLLALSNVRGEVALHRLTWQKVWSLAPPSDGATVKGMAWRPDGKVIAIAYSTNEIVLVDVENKEILHTSEVDGEVTSVTWACEKDSSDTRTGLITKQEGSSKYCNQDDSVNFLPKLPLLSRSFGSVNKCVEENLEDAKKVREQTYLNVLLVGIASGKLYMSIFGLFPCGVLDLNKYVDCHNCSVIDADLSEDLTFLIVMLSCSSDKGEGRQLTVVLFDTPILSAQSCELHTLALKHGQLASLLGYLAHTMSSITEAWENILVEMDSKLASYASTVPEGSVSADFLDLLMFGGTSQELEMFLLQDLTEKGLKKLGHSIELSYSNIQKLVLKHLHSVGQSLVFHLAELRGMARRTDRYQVLGLKEEAVAAAVTAAGAFLVKATEVQQVIDNSMKNYKIFFRWLYVAILRLSDERVPPEITKISQQELAFLAEFLYNFDGVEVNQDTPQSGWSGRKQRFNLERLGQYLVDQELTILPSTENNLWVKFLKDNECVNVHPSIVPHYKKMSLTQQYHHLKDAIDEIFSQPDSSIVQQFQLSNIIHCGNPCHPETPRFTHINIVKDQKLCLAFLDSVSPAEGLYFMELPVGKGASTVRSETKCVYFYFKPSSSRDDDKGTSSPLEVLDVQFYVGGILSVLLEQGGENREAKFAQFQVNTAIGSSSLAGLVNEDGCSSRLPLDCIPRIEAYSLLEPGVLRTVENMVASRFAVSSARKVAVVLSESRRKVRLFEMEVEEDEEDEEGMDGTASSLRDSECSALDTSKGSDINEDNDD
ncbi:anaphase-promoting complex subunit 4 [Anabrus simplex]|uniref:anaphase-promoting complex subunit 4 n=1 Tax=Anabrus simplex TaxID=316456 RepID=UPI0035A2A431